MHIIYRVLEQRSNRWPCLRPKQLDGEITTICRRSTDAKSHTRTAGFLVSSRVLYFTCVSVGSALARLTPACGIESIGDAMDVVLRLQKSAEPTENYYHHNRVNAECSHHPNKNGGEFRFSSTAICIL